MEGVKVEGWVCRGQRIEGLALGDVEARGKHWIHPDQLVSKPRARCGLHTTPEGFAFLTREVELILPIPTTGVGIKGKAGPKTLKKAAGMDQWK